MNQLARLQNWYASQCNGDWEHTFGIKIDTLDNPGWELEIDLEETELEAKEFEPILRGDSESDTDWIYCKVDNRKFSAGGGISNLPEMIETFLQWSGR